MSAEPARPSPELRDLVAASCRAQGVPLRVDDRATLARIARMLAVARARKVLEARAVPDAEKGALTGAFST